MGEATGLAMAQVQREHSNGRGSVSLAGAEALQRLQLLAEVSGALESVTNDYAEAVREVAALCVPAFADLCAIQVVRADGEMETVAYEFDVTSDLQAPVVWEPVSLRDVVDGPVLSFDGNEESGRAAKARYSLGAASLIVVPITEGGITIGCLVAATGSNRRAFRPSALKIGVELAGRLAAALERTMRHRELEVASREQAKAVRRLRRLATAAARLAGASSPHKVLQVACLEARAIGEAEGATARWWMPDGTILEGRSGRVDPLLAEAAFESSAGSRVARGPGWVAYPLVPNQVRGRAVLVALSERDLSPDEELIFSSLASLVPVAFERAVGSDAALVQEARVRAMLSTSPVALVGLGAEGEPVLANLAAQRLFGSGPGPDEVVLPDNIARSFASLAELVQVAGEAANFVVSEPPYELSVAAAPMPPMAGDKDHLSVLLAATDLSEVRQAERALVQAQRLEAMGQVAGRVAHDFNNLLTVIIGYTDLLQRSPSDQGRRLAVANINRAARRATSLTQQLLSLSGQQADGAGAVDLASELREMVPTIEHLAGERVTVGFELPSDQVVVAMGPNGTDQLVLNLALNACQAMEKGGGSLRVRLAVLPHEASEVEPPARSKPPGRGWGVAPAGWAVLSVTDDGPGMADEVRSQCMEPFFTTKARGQGTGLGLSTVNALVVEAGGHVDIESAVGLGTTVTTWLPIFPNLELTPETARSPAWPAGKVLSGRALLVEDVEEVRELSRQALEEAGLLVRVAPDAETALEIAGSERPFDVLVTDVMLPGMSGIQLARSLGAGRGTMQVLFVTGYSKSAGPLPPESSHSQVLLKPYRPEELVFAVAALLGSEALDCCGEEPRD